MDLRKERTKRSIINAFIELRAKKTIEKITIKELSEKALINKATFYQHYQDIYDLSEQLERETVEDVINSIPHPEYMISNPKLAVFEQATAIRTASGMFRILFSGSRENEFLKVLEQELKNKIYTLKPELKKDLEVDIALTILIQGTYHTYKEHEQEDIDEVLRILGQLSERMMSKYIKD